MNLNGRNAVTKFFRQRALCAKFQLESIAGAQDLLGPLITKRAEVAGYLRWLKTQLNKTVPNLGG
jgi:hypothetical protein